jgi:hypothetical protein
MFFVVGDYVAGMLTGVGDQSSSEKWTHNTSMSWMPPSIRS